jgi:hypothetical protein
MLPGPQGLKNVVTWVKKRQCMVVLWKTFTNFMYQVLSSIIISCKNFFLLLLVPTHSYTHPSLLSPVTTGILLNCNSPSHSLTGMSLNCTQMSGCMTINCPLSGTMSTCIILLTLMFPVSLLLHSTPCSLSSTMVNCRNLRTYANTPSEPYSLNQTSHLKHNGHLRHLSLDSHLRHLSHLGSIGNLDQPLFLYTRQSHT